MKRVFTTFLVLASLMTVFTTHSFSQSDEVQNSSEISSKFLQVNFINEAAIYYHAPLSGRLSLRTGFSANWSYRETNNGTEDEMYHYGDNTPDDVRHYTFTGIQNSYTINVSSLAMYRCSDYEYGQFYAGIGPALMYSYSKSTNENAQIAAGIPWRYSSFSTSPTWETGAALSLLLKCKVYGRVSIVSEYAFSATYFWQTYHYSSLQDNSTSIPGEVRTSENRRESKSDGWRFTLSSMRIGLLIGL